MLVVQTCYAETPCIFVLAFFPWESMMIAQDGPNSRSGEPLFIVKLHGSVEVVFPFSIYTLDRQKHCLMKMNAHSNGKLINLTISTDV